MTRVKHTLYLRSRINIDDITTSFLHRGSLGPCLSLLETRDQTWVELIEHEQSAS